MNFDKFFKESEDDIPKVYGFPNGDYYNPMKTGWEGCKQEILKILNDPKNHFYAVEESGNDGIDFNVIDKINKL